MGDSLKRRDFLTGTTSALLLGAMPRLAMANVPMHYDWSATPPMDDRKAFIDILSQGQGEIGGVLEPPPGGLWGMPPDR